MLQKYFNFAALASALIALAGCIAETTEKTAVIDGETVTYHVSPITSPLFVAASARGRVTFAIRPDRLGEAQQPDGTALPRYPDARSLARHEARTSCASKGGYGGFSEQLLRHQGDLIIYLFCRGYVS